MVHKGLNPYTFVERACRRGFTARYIRLPQLLHAVAVGRGDGSYARLLVRLAKLDLWRSTTGCSPRCATPSGAT